MKQSYNKIVETRVSYALLIFFATLWVIPIVWIVLTAFRATPGLLSTSFFPTEYTLDNFSALFDGKNRAILFTTWYKNTLIIAFLNCIASTMVTLSSAYALARFRFTMRKTLMSVALILGMFQVLWRW